VWVLLVMVLSQIYDNVTGKGMSPRTAAIPTAEAVVTPDDTVTTIANLQSCVAANPKNLKCVQDLAGLYYDLKQYPQAQVNYQQAIQLDPHNVALLLRLGGTYIYQQKFSEAAQTLRQADTLQPNSPQILLLLGLALSKSNPPQLDNAVLAWRKVVSLSPGTDYAQQAAQYINESGR
ncbi:MAG: tetratricopeptide repeat protein, partial [Chloroflexota bacterium]|nr:tetratricopeptide repeat protein [Chloroflexota bacterium]